MRVLVCVKRVPAPGATIVLTADGQAIDTAHLGFTVSPHEECAVEEAVRIVERHGGAATVLTAGPAEGEEQLRQAVGVGIGAAVLVRTDGGDWDPQRTAAALVDAIRHLEERDGTFDLVLFGTESADSSGYQVGIRVAHALGRPMVNGVKGVELAGVEAGEGRVTARRPTGPDVEVYELPLPAVLGVREGLNLPRYPTLKGRLASKKVEIEVLEAGAEPGGLRLATLLPPRETVTETVILGEGAAAASAVVDVLEQLGVVQ